MSYILDALQKSERERQRGKIPNIDTEHHADLLGKPKPLIWPWILGGVIIACTGILSYVFWPNASTGGAQIADIHNIKSEPKKPSTTNEIELVDPTTVVASTLTTASKQPVLTKPAPVVPKQNVQLSKPKPVYREAAQPNLPKLQPSQSAAALEVLSKTQSQQPTQRVEVTDNVEYIGEVSSQAGLTSTAQEETTDVESSANALSSQDFMPSISELDDEVIDRIPAFEFSTHIYSSDSAKSFVIINGKALIEKQMVAKNLRLEKIHQSYIVLKVDDTLFRVESLKSWNP